MILAALAYPICAQETEGETEKTIESPSPDGRFAFLKTITPKRKTLDLIEKKSGKVLLRVAESEEDFGNRLSTEVLWAPDSKRFALTYSVVRLGSEVSVYFRTGDTFRPSCRAPERLVLRVRCRDYNQNV